MRLPLKWVTGLLTGNDATAWQQLPPQSKRITIGIGWTAASDAPTGALSIEVSNHGKSGVAGSVYPMTITTGPAGSAGSTVLDKIETSAAYVRLVYTRTSGGTGCVWTDDSGTAGTDTILVVKE
jgi:hypothetical protein